MSQAVGKPVRVQFMRWDEHGWDQFGPAQATDVRAGIDANGNIVAYDYTAYNHGWTQVDRVGRRARRHAASGRRRPARSTRPRSGSFYKIANRRVTSKVVNGYDGFLKGIWLRAPGAPQATFASEQTIDALAHAADMDPIAFRIQNIDATQTSGVGALGRRARRGREGCELDSRRSSASKLGSGQHRHGPRRRDRRLREARSRRSSPTSR